MIEMNVVIKFSNTPDTQLMSPGGYVMKFKDGSMETLDFTYTEIGDPDANNVLIYKQDTLDKDYSTCDDREFLKKFDQLSEFYEFFVFCGEEPTFKPVKVISIEFYDTTSDCYYTVPKDIVNAIQPKCE